ncbi:MAG TPA: thioesterase family protein [Bacilli bacterium]|nr:thioesterase family protein [Bacilli bacterium]
MSESFDIELRVRYGETDQMGVVYHANYLDWFEVGRTEWMRQSGVHYRSLEEEGVLLPVTEARLKYIQSAKYDDHIRVTTRIASYNKVRLTFGYEVRRLPDNELLVAGTTEHVFINREGQVLRIAKTHPEIHEVLAGKGGDS